MGYDGSGGLLLVAHIAPLAKLQSLLEFIAVG